MASFIFQNFVLAPTAAMLVAAFAFFAGGLALIASIPHIRDEALARRVDMVQPGIALTARRPGQEAQPAGEYLFRLPLQGLSASSQREIIRQLSRLGVSAGKALTYFTATRFVLVAILGAVALIAARHVAAFQASLLIPLAIMAMAAIVGWFVPAMIINYYLKQRIKMVSAGLPDALELLVVCVEAGLSLEDGLARVVSELQPSQPALADELALTLADLKILPSRDQALSNLADRVDLPNVRSVVSTLIQTLRYGTPLVQSLRIVASEMRNDYIVDLEERANRLPAFLTLPVILFLMPTIFLIVGGPAALGLLDAFNR